MLKTPEALSDSDAAAISEITAAGAGPEISGEALRQEGGARRDRPASRNVRAARLDDKSDGAPADLAEDAREVLARRLARLAAGGAEE